jgi:hypothetical protein
LRLAFVLRLGNETRPAEGLFEGWIEEVDSCTELRFRSSQDLLKFLGQRFELAMDSSRETQAGGSERAPQTQKMLKNSTGGKSKQSSGTDQ